MRARQRFLSPSPLVQTGLGLESHVQLEYIVCTSCTYRAMQSTATLSEREPLWANVHWVDDDPKLPHAPRNSWAWVHPLFWAACHDATTSAALTPLIPSSAACNVAIKPSSSRHRCNRAIGIATMAPNLLLAVVVVACVIRFSSSSEVPQLHRLPFCELHITSIPQHDREALRDEFAVWMQHKRIAKDMSDLRQRVLDPPKEPAEKFAWKTSMDASQVLARQQASAASATEAEARLGTIMARLREAQLIPAATTDLDLRHCLMGRLNPHKFPAQPVVSFMLQYFKRPHIIGDFVTSLQACNHVVPSEFLVNADNPHEGQHWAELSWNTSGFVVPVFSNNIHEIRSYNRLASLARGKYLVFLQVGGGGGGGRGGSHGQACITATSIHQPLGRAPGKAGLRGLPLEGKDFCSRTRALGGVGGWGYREAYRGVVGM